MSERHSRDVFYLAEARQMVGAVDRPATLSERQSAFRFSRLVARAAPPASDDLLEALAGAMVSAPPETDADVPAGFTYLAQFVDHDMTRDRTKVPFNTAVGVEHSTRGAARRSISTVSMAWGPMIRRTDASISRIAPG